MLKKIASFFSNLAENRKQKKMITSKEFRKIAEEVLYLADIAVRVSPARDKTLDRMNKIREEMDKLTRLVDSRDFTKLPTQVRLDLRESLLSSRDQLVETIHQAPAPTDKLQ